MKLIGLDVGTKRIGVAKADSSTKIAVPDGFINVNGQEFAEIARLARMYNTTTFVVGLPRNNSGEETKQSIYVRDFTRQLAMSIPNARIYFEDESLTSVEAESRLKERKKKYQKGEIDAEAASIILQDFLEHIASAGKITAPAYTAKEAKAENDEVNNDPKVVKKMNGTGKKHKAGRVVITVIVILVVLLALGGGGAYLWYNNNLSAVSNIKCKFETPEAEAKSEEADSTEGCAFKKFEIKENESVANIAKNLKDAGLIRSDLAFRVQVKIRNAVLKSGTYSLRATMSTTEIIDAMIKGVAASNVFNLTILPGETIATIKERLVKHGYSIEEVNTAFEKVYSNKVLNGLYDANGNMSNPSQPRSVQLEGYIFGDTYQFYEGESLEKIINTTINGLNEVVIGNNLEAKFAEKGLTLREGIILASIVQKEAKPDDMPGVAQVFLNRLRIGMTLGSDVTATYAADIDDPGRSVLISNHDVLAHDSLYNTRIHTGLTPGPISNPGISALLAVANPDASKSSMYYFLTGDDGKMYYSSTDSGHLQNVRDHCQTLCSAAL